MPLPEAMSRAAVIPTYSFPVHSIHLEIVTDQQSHGDQGRALQLDRDASLAIAEYAPGAEVVAGGRIWTSEGIARKAAIGGGDAWTEKGYYRICPSCNHVQIHDDREGFEETCPQCGAGQQGLKVRFIEPFGFLTSYTGRMGRDPGSSRLRVRPVSAGSPLRPHGAGGRSSGSAYDRETIRRSDAASHGLSFTANGRL